MGTFNWKFQTSVTCTGYAFLYTAYRMCVRACKKLIAKGPINYFRPNQLILIATCKNQLIAIILKFLLLQKQFELRIICFITSAYVWSSTLHKLTAISNRHFLLLQDN